MRRAAAALLLLVAGAAFAGEAQLERARAEIERLRFDRALEALDAALRAGDNAPSQLAEIHRRLGEVSAVLGLADVAVDHFEHWLTLVPDAQLPDGISPKIVQPFDDARRARAAQPALRAHAEAATRPPSVTLVVESDPLAMVAGARALLRPGGVVERRGVGAPLTIPLPDGRVEVALSAIDRWGNRLVDLAPLVVAPAPPRRRPFIARWYTWGAATLAAAAVGAGLCGAAASAQNELSRDTASSNSYDFSTVRALERSARSEALGCNVSFALAGGLAVTTIALGVVELRK